ncbi:Rossmann-like domain-containing protein [Rhodococcus wratislaviensis]|uniref:Rossmann-like domain-containing protein n=1 Tax=Rhodococcus wratislaviensis TaxID=44752 RepID=UPI0035154C04
MTASAQTGAVAALLDRYRTDPALNSAGGVTVSTAFTTFQGVRHTGRGGGYRNQVISLRVGAATGSCAVEPGSVDPEVVHACAGVPVAELLGHHERSVQVAALDAYLAHLRPHASDARADTVQVEPGDSLQRSLARAQAVTGLVDAPWGGRVLVIGVVNSLLACLRERGVRYAPCDLKGGTTEWGEPIVTDFAEVLDHCDAVLASGMMLGNGSFDRLLESVAASGRPVPVTLFAQSGAAVARELLGRGVDALSAEPYPFFWLTGETSRLYLYRAVCRR